MADQKSTSKNLYVLILSMLPVTTTTATIYMVLPLYFKSVGFSKTDVGLLIALGTLPSAFSSLFMWWLSDHVGRKKLLVISLFSAR